MDATPSISLSYTSKSLGKWYCHWQHDIGVQIYADVNVTLHDVLGRNVVDSLAPVSTTLGWNRGEKTKKGNTRIRKARYRQRRCVRWRAHASFDLNSLVLPRVCPCLLFLHVLQGMAGGIGVSNFSCTPCPQVNEINSS